MTYLDEDPRSSLPTTPTANAPTADSEVRAAQYFDSKDLRASAIRMHNCCFELSHLNKGTMLPADTVDEYAVLLFETSPAIRIRAEEEEVVVDGRAFVVVPPGPSTIEALDAGEIGRVFTTRNANIAEQAHNAANYQTPYPRCLTLAKDIAPSTGLRVHLLADYPIQAGIFGRIFRTADLMVNFLADEEEPRDAHKLSPHHHDDFEQMSVTVSGDFVHHIRYPWLADSAHWRPDEHQNVSSPSVTVIPPPTIHTTQGISSRHRLIDIFSPPREDFGARPGWVRNAHEYVNS